MDGHPRPRAGEVYAATFVSLRDTTSAEIAAAAGFDVVFVDLEHGTVPYAPADYVRAVEAGGATPWLRADHTTAIQPWLDAGVRGVLFSRCTSADGAQAMVERVAWPPRGARGLSAAARVGRYATVAVDVRAPAPEAAVGVVIEDLPGLEAADGILATPGVSLVVVGLTDLGIALAAHRSSATPTELADEVVDHVERLAASAGQHDVVLALPLGHPATAAASRPLAVRPGMYLSGSDVTAMAKQLAAHLEAVRRA